MTPSSATAKNGSSNGNGHRVGQLRIVIAKSNPSRGNGFEVAHFEVRGGRVKSLSERDVFLPSLTKAAKWVWSHYPSATMERGRNDHTGHLAALCFCCALADLDLQGSKN